MTKRGDESARPDNRSITDEIQELESNEEPGLRAAARTQRSRAGHAAAAAAGTAAGVLATDIDEPIVDSLNFFSRDVDEADDGVVGDEDPGTPARDSELESIDFSIDEPSAAIEDDAGMDAAISIDEEPFTDDAPSLIQTGIEPDPLAGPDSLSGLEEESLVPAFDDEIGIDEFDDDGDELP